MNDSKQPSCGDLFSSQHRTVHLLWVIVLLVLSVVLSLSHAIVDPLTRDYINFAATLVSLVLGVVAIVYAFVSTTPLNQAATVVATSASEVKRETENFRALAERVESNMRSFNQSSEDIKKSLGELQSGVQKVDKNIVDLHQRALLQFNSGLRPPETVSSEREKNIKAFISFSSIGGLCVIYAAGLAAKSNKQLNLPDLHRAMKLLTLDYIVGYLMCTGAGGLFSDFRLDGSGNPLFVKRIQIPEAQMLVDVCQSRFESLEADPNLSFLKGLSKRIQDCLLDAEDQTAA